VDRKPNGSPDIPTARAAAAAIVQGYNIIFRPSLTSLPIFGKAIDMSIESHGTPKIKQKNGSR
jgi:hypothetical protein